MIVVIIAGGSGTRLWPLSTPSYPKQLIRLNGGESLLQSTATRARQLSKDIYVLSVADYTPHIKKQIPDISDDQLIIEPARRGTANCIAAALAHLEGKHDPTEPIIFMHTDHYIRDTRGFEYCFKIAGHVSRTQNRIVLVGVEPDHPSTAFGYIKKGSLLDQELLAYGVRAFEEKPAFDLAKKYVKTGNYLWNCGYFVGSLDSFRKAMDAHAPELAKTYKKLRAAKTAASYKKTYLGLKDEVIDRALMEKVKDLLVIPASFDWMDIGSYGDLHKAVDSDERGNHIHGKHVALAEVENAFVQNHDDRPLAVIGLDNIVVINTKDGILVARKDLSQKVGEVSKSFKT